MSVQRVCVVTGAAAGLGHAIVTRFAAAGDAVAIVDRDKDRSEEVLTSLRDSGATAESFPTNVADEDAVILLAAALKDRFGRVDVLVNNAGYASREGSVVDMTRKAWDMTIAVNLTGPFLVSRHLVPLMPPGSAIVNVGTTGAVRAVPETDAYVAAKGGLIALSKAMALSLADRGIRVNVANPGVVVTDEVAKHLDNPRLQKMLERSRPLRAELGRPDEFAAVVEFLAGDGAAYINGTVVNVDGGALC
ncbi:MAG: short chain dehydrogenase [Pseudonocardiales bacterium]|nr:short chain dehydrogenase [Pseudonocardiales bacterium]